MDGEDAPGSVGAVPPVLASDVYWDAATALRRCAVRGGFHMTVAVSGLRVLSVHSGSREHTQARPSSAKRFLSHLTQVPVCPCHTLHLSRPALWSLMTAVTSQLQEPHHLPPVARIGEGSGANWLRPVATAEGGQVRGRAGESRRGGKASPGCGHGGRSRPVRRWHSGKGDALSIRRFGR